jgi:bifunctional ADP-heptose synthase (sugar kinase/adenylyltransferase)
MNKEKLQKLLKDISTVNIVVVGDFCLDAYWFIDESMSEISVETGEATRPVSEQRYSPGGAGNVTNNLAALGVRKIQAFGVIGTDPFGAEMVKIIKDSGINTDNLLVQEKYWQAVTRLAREGGGTRCPAATAHRVRPASAPTSRARRHRLHRHSFRATPQR